MKLTPVEIRKQEFKKSMRGYDTVEIDTFIELVANEYENLLQENEGLKKQIISMEAELKHFKEAEKTLKETLYKVQETSQLSKANSEKEATLIMKEADLHAAQITEKAKMEVHKMREELVALKQQKDSFVARLRHLLVSQIELIDVLSIDDEELAVLKDRTKKGFTPRVQKEQDSDMADNAESGPKSAPEKKAEQNPNQDKTDQAESRGSTKSGKKAGRDFFKDIFSDNIDAEEDL